MPPIGWWQVLHFCFGHSSRVSILCRRRRRVDKFTVASRTQAQHPAIFQELLLRPLVIVGWASWKRQQRRSIGMIDLNQHGWWHCRLQWGYCGRMVAAVTVLFRGAGAVDGAPEV